GEKATAPQSVPQCSWEGSSQPPAGQKLVHCGSKDIGTMAFGQPWDCEAVDDDAVQTHCPRATSDTRQGADETNRQRAARETRGEAAALALPPPCSRTTL
ncbi:hypothetical protein H8958_003011, partial [Nasalis larvatus]